MKRALLVLMMLSIPSATLRADGEQPELKTVPMTGRKVTLTYGRRFEPAYAHAIADGLESYGCPTTIKDGGRGSKVTVDVEGVKRTRPARFKTIGDAMDYGSELCTKPLEKEGGK